jgi:hypothetical protein
MKPRSGREEIRVGNGEQRMVGGEEGRNQEGSREKEEGEKRETEDQNTNEMTGRRSPFTTQSR